MAALHPDFTDEELREVVKSLGITLDSLSNKLGRVVGPMRESVLSEYHVCEAALSKSRGALTIRLTAEVS